MRLLRKLILTPNFSGATPSRAWGWMRLGIAALLMLAATMPAFSSHARSDAENPPQTGSVHGNLIDQNQGGSSGLAGITVLLTTIPADGNALTADSDDTGRYEFTNLKAGNYTLSISQPGFNPVTNTVSVLPGKAVIQDIKLELETVSEKVEVHEENPAISTESSATPTETVTEQEIAALPTAQEKIKEVLPITPGVIRTLDGKLNFKGSDENQSLLLVNSARTADPATGSFSISVPSDAVQSFAVFKTPYNAGLGSFSGGLTTIETKPPQDRWNFRVKNPVPFVLGKNGQISGLGEATPGVDFEGRCSAASSFSLKYFSTT